jgi:hypothetical protein
MHESTTDCRLLWQELKPGETIRCSVCNRELKTFQDCIQSEKRALCEDCYRALVYPNKGSGIE